MFYVEYLPEAVRRRLAEAAPGYRWAASLETFDWCWANHCEHCGSCLDDFELFCEPDDAFVPTSAGAARAIRMLAVEEPIEAAAAGYAPDPPFFDCMSIDRT